MRVKMLTVECGPAGNFYPGDERDVSDEQGRQLVAGKHAVDVTPRLVAKAPEAAAETAAVAPQETAAMPAPKRRKGR
jgi:hypothetical protein